MADMDKELLIDWTDIGEEMELPTVSLEGFELFQPNVSLPDSGADFHMDLIDGIEQETLIEQDLSPVKLELDEAGLALGAVTATEITSPITSPEHSSSSGSEHGFNCSGTETSRSSATTTDETVASREDDTSSEDLASAEQKLRRGVKLTRKERRALENKEFPREILKNLSGTTSIDVRKMTEEERRIVYFKRKLRNRESAKRSRMKRQMMAQAKAASR